MLRYLKLLHLYLYVFSVSVLFCLLFPFFYYYSRKPERYPSLNRLRYFFALVSSAIVGFFYRFHKKAEIDWTKTYIFCPNHFSNLDISIATLICRSNYAFMGKEELSHHPIFKIFVQTIDIPVNRDSKMSSFRAFKKAEEYLEKKISLIIFPEGKIGDEYPPLLHSFKNGPFKLAIEHQIPIIPVTIINAWQKLWDDGLKYGSSPGICDICIHKPIETHGLTMADADSLRDRVYEIIDSELKKNEAQ
ncbi:MAG TPA: 1-acyl-sn-glycerol-3-phosphate acyltransferase [Sphingobacteriaceae bacterium]|nr:1-acyl-sn-glycerol-3-phosphate acyltransferase [Sphingobacteriaceae bacterium]